MATSSATQDSPILGQKRKHVSGYNGNDGALENVVVANSTPQTVILSSSVGEITIPVPVTYKTKQFAGQQVQESLTVTGVGLFWKTTRNSKKFPVCMECAKQGSIIPLKDNSCAACEVAYKATLRHQPQVMHTQESKGTVNLVFAGTPASSPLIYVPHTAETKERTSNKVTLPVQEQIVINGKSYPVTPTQMGIVDAFRQARFKPWLGGQDHAMVLPNILATGIDAKSDFVHVGHIEVADQLLWLCTCAHVHNEEMRRFATYKNRGVKDVVQPTEAPCEHLM